MSSIRDRIENVTHAFHISQAEFARRIGVTPQLVSLVVNEKTPLSYLTAKAIESEFGVNHEWLMNGAGEMMLSKPVTFRDVNLAPELVTALGYYPAIVEELNRIARNMSLSEWEALNTFLQRMNGTTQSDPQANACEPEGVTDSD